MLQGRPAADQTICSSDNGRMAANNKDKTCNGNKTEKTLAAHEWHFM